MVKKKQPIRFKIPLQKRHERPVLPGRLRKAEVNELIRLARGEGAVSPGEPLVAHPY